MNNKRKFWKILLFIGIFPFAFLIYGGISAAIGGSEGLCIFGGYEKIYGVEAFLEYIYVVFMICFPIFIIATLFIIVSIIKLRKNFYNF